MLQVEAALAASGIDFAKPTIVMSECVLVYMKPDESNALVSYLAKAFSTAAIVVRACNGFAPGSAMRHRTC